MAYEIDTFPGRTVSIKGEPHLYFGGTGYLGLQTDALFQDFLLKMFGNTAPTMGLRQNRTYK